MRQLYLGIDGGGTNCRARIRDGAGALLGEAEGGLANIYQDFDAAMAAILATARAAAARAGVQVEALHAGLGLAGATGPSQCARVLAAGLPFASVAVDSDGCAACLGAHGGGDGGIVIAGTGSAGFAIVGGRRLSVGGHGFILGDQGSGAVLGREALRAALLAHDGIAPASALAAALMARFGGDPGAMIEWSRGALSRDYASFAPQVLAAAGQGDAMARALVAESAAGLAAIALQLRRGGAARLSLVGGLGAAMLPFLQPEVAALFQPALADPVDGAILMARRSGPR